MDTWLLLRNLETGGERNRGLYVLKSRGMAHSNQIREFVLSPEGVDLVDVYTGPEGVLTGSARLAQRASEQAAERQRREKLEEHLRRFERKRTALLAQIAALNAELEEEAAQVERAGLAETARRDADESLRSDLAQSRGADRGSKPSGTTRTRKRNGRSEVRS
jgi:circadian clock protein KaiC